MRIPGRRQGEEEDVATGTDDEKNENGGKNARAARTILPRRNRWC
jgi:hypothetical protein